MATEQNSNGKILHSLAFARAEKSLLLVSTIHHARGPAVSGAVSFVTIHDIFSRNGPPMMVFAKMPPFIQG
jgi:hypothetical protein